MKIRQKYPFSDSKKLSPLLAFNEVYLAYAFGSSVELVDYESVAQKVERLESHRKPVKCLKFSRKSQGAAARVALANQQLCSCSQDRVVVWTIDSAAGGSHSSSVVAQDLSFEPTDCSFHPIKNLLAVSNGSVLNLFDTDTCFAVFQVEFNDYLSSVEFCLFNWDLIAITNRSNVLQVYDTAKRQVAFQVRSDSINSVFTSDSQPLIVATTTTGLVNIYEFLGSDFRLRKSVRLEALFREYQSRLWSSSSSQTESFDPSALCIGAELLHLEPGLGIKFENKSIVGSDVHKLVLVYGTTSYLFVVDLDAASLLDVHDWRQGARLDKTLFIPHVVGFCSSARTGQIRSAVLSIFQNEIDVIQIAQTERARPLEAKPADAGLKSHSVLAEDAILTVFPQMNLVDNSPLKSAVTETETKTEKAPSMQEYLRQTSTLKKSQSASSIQAKPLTFNSRIKSSGYNSQPRKDRFVPQINKKPTPNLSNLQALNKNIEMAMKNSDKKLQATKKPEFKFELPTALIRKLNADDHRRPVVHMKFTDNGQSLLMATADNVIQILQPKGLDKARTYLTGHKDQIRSIDASHDGNYLLSCSDDKTCKIWSLRKPNNLLLDVDSFSTATQKSVAFQKEVVSASFFYLDKFILVGTENKFHTFKYSIDTNKNDVQRYLTGSVFKRVAQMELMAAQNLVCMSAINTFFSYLVLCGGSDKSVEIFDMNQARSCLLIKDAHSRVFHQIVQNGSEHNSHSYDLFLTNAVGDGVKLWDMRIAQCTMKLENHVNRCLAKTVAFSPDSNYVAAGSEDRSLFVYDLRTGCVAEKLGTFSDTVSCVQFNPQRSQAVLGTQDGNLYEYSTSSRIGAK